MSKHAKIKTIKALFYKKTVDVAIFKPERKDISTPARDRPLMTEYLPKIVTRRPTERDIPSIYKNFTSDQIRNIKETIDNNLTLISNNWETLLSSPIFTQENSNFTARLEVNPAALTYNAYLQIFPRKPKKGSNTQKISFSLPVYKDSKNEEVFDYLLQEGNTDDEEIQAPRKLKTTAQLMVEGWLPIIKTLFDISDWTLSFDTDFIPHEGFFDYTLTVRGFRKYYTDREVIIRSEINNWLEVSFYIMKVGDTGESVFKMEQINNLFKVIRDHFKTRMSFGDEMECNEDPKRNYELHR